MKAMNAILRKIAPLFFVLFSASVLMGQVATGTYPYGTFDSKGFDTINVGNLNTHFAIPVLNKAGRGIPLQYNLAYDSSIWYPATVSGAKSWVLVQNQGWSGIPSFGYLSMTSTTSTIIVGVPPHQATCHETTYNNWIYHDKTGVLHPFQIATVVETGSCTLGSSSGTSTASDGSGYVLSLTNYTQGTITFPSGAITSPPTNSSGGSATSNDTNGNHISVDANGDITDTTGNVVLSVSGTPPNTPVLSYKDTSGNSRSVSVTYKTYTVQTAFGCSGIGEYGPKSTSLVDTISYANGSTYHFSYEQTPRCPCKCDGANCRSGITPGKHDSVQLYRRQ